MPTSRINLITISWTASLIAAYYILFYELIRTDFLLYFALFSFAFLAHLAPVSPWAHFFNARTLVTTGVTIKLMAVMSIPTLSEDIYRYIWDGYLSINGISPYAFTPDQCIQVLQLEALPLLPELHTQLNSAQYHSVYPPVSQVFFNLAGWAATLWGVSIAVLIFKITLLILELFAWIFTFRLFRQFKPDLSWFYLLWLNPLILLEWNFSGHLESLAYFFIAGSIYSITQKKTVLSSLLLALAVLVKLWPLIFAPFFIKYIVTKKEKTRWVIGFSIAILICSIPLWAQSIYLDNFRTSLSLYFSTFEFNASIYYILREIVSLFTGYNPIHIVGPACSVILALSMIYLYLKSSITGFRNLVWYLLASATLYLLLATTVHPWYLSMVLPFAYMYRSITWIIWSYLIFISYHAYAVTGVYENNLLLGFSYLMLLTCAWFEYNSVKRATLTGR